MNGGHSDKGDINSGRRRAIKTILLASGAVALTRIELSSEYARSLSRFSIDEAIIPPPGVHDMTDFLGKCTSCGLCVKECPTWVLALREYYFPGVGALTPARQFDDSFCRIVCNRCGSVCPTGAIPKLTKAQKRVATNGLATVDLSKCISAESGVSCGLCARRCPTEAIVMNEVAAGDRPIIDVKKCVGCGACRYFCPSEEKAISITRTI